METGKNEFFCRNCKKPQAMTIHNTEKVVDKELGDANRMDVSCKVCGAKVIIQTKIT